MTNYVGPGNVWLVTLSANTAANTAVLMGNVLGVHVTGGVTGQTVAVNVTGAYFIPKKAADVATQGAPLYWDVSLSAITVTAASNKLVGYAMAPALAADTVVNCKLIF